MPKPIEFGWLAIAAALLIAPAASSADPFLAAQSAPMRVVHDPTTPEERARVERQRWDSLSRAAFSIPAERAIAVHYDEAALDAMQAEQDCTTCGSEGRRQLVGLALETALPVSFDGLRQMALDSTPRAFGPGEAVRLADGSVVWSARVDSPGASMLRLRLEDFSLPRGVELFVFNEFGDSSGPYTGNGQWEGYQWTEILGGDQLFVEVRLADGADERLLDRASFVIGAVEHTDARFFGDYAASLSGGDDDRDRAACSFNAPCIESAECYTTSDFAALADARRAVAQIIFSIPGGGQGICSGGLVAHQNPEIVIPYFITAHHCFSTQFSATSASFAFDFRKANCATTSCPNRANSAFPKVTGATLLHTAPDNASGQDITFLRLNSTPSGTRAYMGWDTTTPAVGTVLHRVCHPNGAPQSYSRSTIVNPPLTCTSLPLSQYIYHTVNLNGIEGGSSGSILMRNDGRIVGQLFGTCGSSGDSCNNTLNRSVDGRFSQYFPAISSFLTTELTVEVARAPGQSNPAFGFPIEFEIEFSEPVTGLQPTSIQNSGNGIVLNANLLGGPQTYTYRINNGTIGTYTISIPANAAESAATPGITNTASTGSENTVEYLGPADPPSATINQGATQADPTKDLPVRFDVVFGEAVTGFTFSDVQFSGTATVLGGSVSGTGANYTVSVTAVGNDGTITATIPEGAANSTLTGAASAASTSTDNTVTLDQTPPTVVINRAGTQPPETEDLPLAFLYNFSENISGFSAANVVVATGLGTPVVSIIPLGAGVRFFRVEIDFVDAPEESGTVTVGINEAGILDAVGNAMQPSAASASVSFIVPEVPVVPTGILLLGD